MAHLRGLMAITFSEYGQKTNDSGELLELEELEELEKRLLGFAVELLLGFPVEKSAYLQSLGFE